MIFGCFEMKVKYQNSSANSQNRLLAMLHTFGYEIMNGILS
jgi:hypothetical protein